MCMRDDDDDGRDYGIPRTPKGAEGPGVSARRPDRKRELSKSPIETVPLLASET